MKIYDECFSGVESVLSQYPVKRLEYNTPCNYPKAENNQIILQNDTAYELGGGRLPAVSSIALTDSKELVPSDEILLVGRDLYEIKADSPFARIALIRVNENEMGTGEKLYQAIRKIEFARYHINPEGYMIRISAFTHREAARVSKAALVKGISFTDIGSIFINEYKKNPQVEAVKLLFVTDTDFPYDKLEAVMQKSEDITKALDHLMKNIKMDCDTCSLKAVCEEVEALCEKDFPNDNKQ